MPYIQFMEALGNNREQLARKVGFSNALLRQKNEKNISIRAPIFPGRYGISLVPQPLKKKFIVANKCSSRVTHKLEPNFKTNILLHKLVGLQKLNFVFPNTGVRLK